ncbi:MAG: acetolactate synthase large subunit [Deltaproteobacteria bacterium]|nr:MAG: acetolactate synthase large subunit [Deltaproteobacteria bacterium]
MKASDLFLRCLEAEGVEYIFGVPGEENADIMISLLDSSIRFIICRHEQGAAFMADLYGRLTGRPGVCLATLGPGATNLVTGVANAHMDRSPLVALTGQGATTRLHKESHQIMDVVGMFKPITKWASSIHDERNIPEVVRKAFKLAAAEKPGATLIELPEDVAKREVKDQPIVPGLKVRRPVPDEKSVNAALDLIGRARLPVILAGNGCIRTRVSKQLNRFIDKTGIYAAMTFMGKGAISDQHPRSLYAAGLGSRDHVALAFERADLVIAIGYDMVEWHPSLWNVGVEKRILHIDFTPAEVDGSYRPEVEAVGDIAATLWAINERLGSEHRTAGSEFSDVRETLVQELEREHAADEGFPMKPQRILSDLRQEMDPEDILISDVGAHKMWVARHYPTYAPNSCIISNGFCSMGIALPGAISAKLVHPDRNVVGLCGDGGFMMNVQELATAVQYEIASIHLVWEDSEYGLIRWKQETMFGRHSHIGFTNPDLVDLSRSFGCFAKRVNSPKELRPTLREAFQVKGRPSVIVVPVDYAENMKLTQRLGELLCH